MAERGGDEALTPAPRLPALYRRVRVTGAALLGRRPRMPGVAGGGRLARYYNLYVAPPRYGPEQRRTLTTSDGVRLNAWLVPGPPDALCTFVLVHGFVNSSRSPGVHRFAHLLARRAHVVVPDMRGHGRSGGLCSMGRNEPLDVAAAVAAAPAGLAVVTVGTSLGGAAVLMHAGTYGGVAGVVGISAPAWGDLDRVGTHRVRKLVGGRAGRLVLAAALRTRVGPDCIFLPDAGSVVAKIAPSFTVVVHDPDDWYFGPAHAEAIYEWAGEPKALWWYPGGGHGGDLLVPELADRILAETATRLAAAGAVESPVAGPLKGEAGPASAPPTS